jgi:hypothetical protein
MTITVPIYYQQSKKKRVLMGLNWLRTAHFQVINKAKKHYHELIMCACNQTKPIRGAVHVHYDIYVGRKGTDGGNIRSVIEKFVLDGLVKAKVLKDDNFEIVVSDSANYYLDRGNPRAEITVTKK